MRLIDEENEERESYYIMKEKKAKNVYPESQRQPSL